jgi:hypothetical protein
VSIFTSRNYVHTNVIMQQAKGNDLALPGKGQDVRDIVSPFTQEGRPKIKIMTKGAPVNLAEQADPSNEKRSLRRGVFGYCIPVLLPIASAIATAIAAVNHGPVRVYWVMGAVAAIGVSSTLSVIKERRTKSAYRNSEVTKSELATKLADIGYPLLTALGDVTCATKLDEAVAAINVLVDRSVSLTQTQLGQQSGIICHIRATYYEFNDAKNQLKRNKCHVWAGAKLPRMEFTQGKNDHDDDVIRLATREDYRFIRNLDSEALPGTTDSGSRSYKALISVPVRVGKNSYGLLTADSDVAYSLTTADRGFLILVAGTLAAGLAHMEAVKSTAKS